MARVITWALKSEAAGRYNPTFTWELLPQFFAFASRYWDIDFRRVNSGERFRVIQSARNGPGWMWAIKSRLTMWVHPHVNWQRSAGDCASAVLHEFCHLAGYANHQPDPLALMHANGGICDNYIAADYQYMQVYPWRGALRPHSERTKLRDTFSGATVSVNADEPLKYLEQDSQTITQSSGLHRCGECRKSWWDAVRAFVCPGDVP